VTRNGLALAGRAAGFGLGGMLQVFCPKPVLTVNYPAAYSRRLALLYGFVSPRPRTIADEDVEAAAAPLAFGLRAQGFGGKRKVRFSKKACPPRIAERFAAKDVGGGGGRGRVTAGIKVVGAVDTIGVVRGAIRVRSNFSFGGACGAAC